MRRLPAIVLVLGVLAGCGGSDPNPPIERDAEAVTSPGTTIPYELGGADGSGADGDPGTRDPEKRGGIAAGPDRSGERK